MSKPLAINTGTTTLLVVLTSLIQSSAATEPIDGFLTPFRTIDVATAETGIVREIAVRNGETVKPGQVLARLEDDVHSWLLAIAEKHMESEGRVRAARAEHQVKLQRLTKLEELVGRDNAVLEEVKWATADAEIAAAQLAAAEDELGVKRMEYERARVQMDRRVIRAPRAGVVLKLHKEPGEFIGSNDPRLLTIVQLDPLLAVFAVPSRIARRLTVGQRTKVRIPESNAQPVGVVESVSAVVDGKSGTMWVEVRLENLDRRFLSGEPCSLLIDATDLEQDAGDRFSATSLNGYYPTP